MVLGAVVMALGLTDWQRLSHRESPPAPQPTEPQTRGLHLPKEAAKTPAGQAGPLLAAITPTSQSIKESAAEAVFKIELSAPAERPLVLIFATLDDSAKAGEDYEPMRGALTIEAGAEVARLHLRPVNDARPEGTERLELLLSTDPAMLRLTTRRVSATIEDDD